MLSYTDEAGEEANQQKAEEFLSEGRKKEITSAIESIIEDEFYRLEEYASEHLNDVARRRAEGFLKTVLEGDHDAASELFGAGSSSRYREIGWDAGKPWASIIHGSLFQSSQMKLREKLVAAHPDLLRNERIADLESIVDGLTRQIKSLESDLNRALDDYR